MGHAKGILSPQSLLEVSLQVSQNFSTIGMLLVMVAHIEKMFLS